MTRTQYAILGALAFAVLVIFALFAMFVAFSLFPMRPSLQPATSQPIIVVATLQPTQPAKLAPTAKPASSHVRLQVGGYVYDSHNNYKPANGFITYKNAQGGTAQTETLVKTLDAWTYDFDAMPGMFVYVSAQKRGDQGFIDCYIWIDGKLWKNTQSDADYGIATCSGSLPQY